MVGLDEVPAVDEEKKQKYEEKHQDEGKEKKPCPQYLVENPKEVVEAPAPPDNSFQEKKPTSSCDGSKRWLVRLLWQRRHAVKLRTNAGSSWRGDNGMQNSTLHCNWKTNCR